MRWERINNGETLIANLSIAIWGVKTLQRRELSASLPCCRKLDLGRHRPREALRTEIDLDFAESERIPDPSRI
jgi:hypothetical protein